MKNYLFRLTSQYNKAEINPPTSKNHHIHVGIGRVSVFMFSFFFSCSIWATSSFFTWTVADPDCSDLTDCSVLSLSIFTSVVFTGYCLPVLSGLDHSVTIICACNRSLDKSCSRLNKLSRHNKLSDRDTFVVLCLSSSVPCFEVPQEKKNTIHIYNMTLIVTPTLLLRPTCRLLSHSRPLTYQPRSLSFVHGRS